MYKNIIFTFLTMFIIVGCGSNTQPKIKKDSLNNSIENSQIIWDGRDKYLTYKENNFLIEKYLVKKYPKKAKKWNAYQKKIKLEKNKYTTTINSLMWQDNKEVINNTLNWKEAKNYIICPQGLKIGDKIDSGKGVEIKIGIRVIIIRRRI